MESEPFILPNTDGVQLNIQQNIREIRAILKTNAEIFDRCMPLAIDHIIYEDKGVNRTLFARMEINQVFTRHNQDKLSFVVHPRLTDKSFDTSVLSNAPESLKGIFVEKYKKPT